MKQEIKEAAIKLIISRAKQGIDCTESESAEIKGYLRDNYGSELYKELAYLFPSEHCEILEEQESKEVSNVSEYYITNIRKGKGSRDIYTYAELREVGTNELAIASTLDYINRRIERGFYKLAEPKEEPVSDFEIGDTIQKINSDGEIIGFPFTATQSEVYRKDWYTLIKKKETTVSVSVEEAANKQFNNVGFNDEDGAHYCYIAGARFGANWNEKQSEELIKELLEALKMANNLAKATYRDFSEWVESPVIESAITKAEQYLNK